MGYQYIDWSIKKPLCKSNVLVYFSIYIVVGLEILLTLFYLILFTLLVNLLDNFLIMILHATYFPSLVTTLKAIIAFNLVFFYSYKKNV